MTRAWTSRAAGERRGDGGEPGAGRSSARAGEPVRGRCDDVTAWLDVVTTLMRASESERRAVREELEGHLRERVRDLVLSGSGEREATARAIGELGDAAHLARRFDEAIEPSKRRLVMQVAAMCLAGTAVLFSGIAVVSSGGGAARPAVGMAISPAKESADVTGGGVAGEAARWVRRPEGAGGAPPGVGASRYVAPEGPEEGLLAAAKVGRAGEMSLREVLGRLEGAGPRVLVRWDRFDAVGVQPDQMVRVAEADASVGSVLKELALDLGPSVPAAAARDGLVVVAPRSFLDKMEQELVAYDLTGIAARRGGDPEAAVEQICALITTLAEPDMWSDNGGDGARLTSYDGRLFVTAPPRVQARVAWVLAELSRGDGLAGARGAHGGSMAMGPSGGGGRANVGALDAGAGRMLAGGPAADRLVVRAEGTAPMVVEMVGGKVGLREGDRIRMAAEIEVELPEGWVMWDEWRRPVVPAKTPGPGDRKVLFSAPNGGLFAVWRRTGITGSRHELLPPGLEPVRGEPGGPGGGAGAGSGGGAGGGAGGGSGGGPGGAAAAR